MSTYSDNLERAASGRSKKRKKKQFYGPPTPDARNTSRAQATMYRGRRENAQTAQRSFTEQLFKDQLARNTQLAGQSDMGADMPSPGGGGGYGGGGGGGGYAPPDVGAINRDYQAQVGQVNTISAETAAKLKAIQDQYAASAAAAGQQIARDTTQLQAGQTQQTGQINTDLQRQGVNNAPVQQAAQVNGQALQDAQLRGQTYVNQLSAAQTANFGDRQAQNVQSTGGYLQMLQQQQQAALAGGGAGGSGGGGSGGGGAGLDYKDRMNAQGMLNLGQDALPEQSGYRDWLREQGNGAFKGKPRLQAALTALRAGSSPDSLYASSRKRHGNVRAFLKAASKQKGSKKKANSADAIRAAYRMLQAGRG